MEPWFDQISGFVETHDVLISWLVFASVAVFVLSLLMVPVLVIRLPADYFSRPGRQRSALFANNPMLSILVKIIRNILGAILVFLGLLMLILPGQGIICIILGIIIADFPGKHKLVNWLASKKGVINTMNWMRRKANKKPIQPLNEPS